MNNDEYVPGRTGEPERRDPPTRRPWFRDNWYINKFAEFKAIQAEIIAYRKNWLFRTRRNRIGGVPGLETRTQDPSIPQDQPAERTPNSGGSPERPTATPLSPVGTPVSRSETSNRLRLDLAGTKEKHEDWFAHQDKSQEEEDDDEQWLAFGNNRSRFGKWRKKTISDIQKIDDDEEREKEFTILDDLINNDTLISFFRNIRKESFGRPMPAGTAHVITDIVLEASEFIAEQNIQQQVAEDILAELIQEIATELDTNAETVINMVLPTIPAIDVESDVSDVDDADVSFQAAMDELDEKLRNKLKKDVLPPRNFPLPDDQISDPAYWNWKKGMGTTRALLALQPKDSQQYKSNLQYLESIRRAPARPTKRTQHHRPHLEHDLGLDFSEEDDDLMDDLANAFSKAKAKPPTEIRPSFRPPDNYIPPVRPVSPIFAAKDLPAILRNAKRKAEDTEEGQKFIRNRNREHKRPLNTDTTGELRSGKQYKESR